MNELSTQTTQSGADASGAAHGGKQFKVVVVSFDNEASNRISSALDGLASVASVEPQGNLANTIVDTMGADLVIVDGDASVTSGDNLLSLVQSLKDRYPDLPAIALGDESAAQRVLAAMRAGAVDFLERDSTQEEFRAQIAVHLKRYRTSEMRAAARVRAVVSARGNEGEAAFALNLATVVARDALEHDTMLMDFAVPGGEIELGFGLNATYTVRDAVADMPRMDRTLIASVMAFSKPANTYLLPLTSGQEAARDVNGAAILSMIGLMRPMFQDIVINGGALVRGGGLQQLLPLVDETYFVVRQELASVKAASEMIKRNNIEEADRRKLILVIPEHDKTIALSAEQIADTLGLRKTLLLPPSRADLTNAMNTGNPLALSMPGHGYVRALARGVAGDGARVADKTGLMNSVMTAVDDLLKRDPAKQGDKPKSKKAPKLPTLGKKK